VDDAVGDCERRVKGVQKMWGEKESPPLRDEGKVNYVDNHIGWVERADHAKKCRRRGEDSDGGLYGGGSDSK